MGTGAGIVARASDGRWATSYVNFDGYVNSVGLMLHEYYGTQARVDALLAHGHMSSLGESPDCPEGHSYDRPVDGYCVFYGRDRGEEDVDTDYYHSFQEAFVEGERQGQFTYVWDGVSWHYDGQTIKAYLAEEAE